MKSGWPIKNLGEVCGFVRGPFGGSLKKSVFVKNGFAVYEQQHAICNQFKEIRYFIDEEKFKEMRRFELHPNDLIMSCSGTMGKVAIVPHNLRPGIINQALLKLTPSTSISSEFLKYWMDSTDFQDGLKEQSGGAAIQNVASVSILKEIKIPLPAFPEQQRIVGILNKAFDGIAIAKANAEKNLQNARALFESHLQSVFSQHGVRWPEVTLEDVIDLLPGFAFKSTGYTDSENSVRLLRGDNIVQGSLRWDDVKKWPASDISEYGRYQLREGDVVLAMDRPWIKAGLKHAMISVADLPCLLVQRTARLRCDPRIGNQFLMYLLGGSNFTKHILGVQTGIGVPHISGQQIKSFSFLLPSLPEQRRISNNLNGFRKETQRLESIYQQKVAALDELKKSLLHQAFAGGL